VKTRKKISKRTIKRVPLTRKKTLTSRVRSTLSKPKNHFAELAPLIEISYTDLVTGKKKKHKFPRNSNKLNGDIWVLLWNPETEELVGIKRGRTADVTPHVPEKNINPHVLIKFIRHLMDLKFHT